MRLAVAGALMIRAGVATAAAAGPVLPADAAADCADARDAIVVCGRRPHGEGQRLPRLPDTWPTTTLPKAETRLFGDVRAGIGTEGVGIGGVPSNRVMMRFTIPLGGRRR